ncbi:hypothetical protein GCM10010442_50000 [Kitasatospora kifunensis]
MVMRTAVAAEGRRGGHSADRYRALADAGMSDLSSWPHHSSRRLPARTERRNIKVRVLRRWGPPCIVYLLRLDPAAVHRVLIRYRLRRRPTARLTGHPRGPDRRQKSASWRGAVREATVGLNRPRSMNVLG